MSAHDEFMKAGAKRERDDENGAPDAGASVPSSDASVATRPKKTRLQVLLSQAANCSAEFLAAGISSGREWANATMQALASSAPEDTVMACQTLAATALRNVATSALSSLRSAFPASEPLPAIEQNVLAAQPDDAEQRDNDPKGKRPASEPVPAIVQAVDAAQPVTTDDGDPKGKCPATPESSDDGEVQRVTMSCSLCGCSSGEESDGEHECASHQWYNPRKTWADDAEEFVQIDNMLKCQCKSCNETRFYHATLLQYAAEWLVLASYDY